MPEFDFSLLYGPIGGILSVALMTGVIAGWRIRMAQDKATIANLIDLIEHTKEDLKESDEVCKERVKHVQNQLEAMGDRYDKELTSMRAMHRDEVDAWRAMLSTLLQRLDDRESQ